MKKLLTVLALVSISAVYAGPYDQSYQQPYNTQSNYRSYQAEESNKGSNTNYGYQKPSQNVSNDQEITKNINATINSAKYGSGFKDVKFQINNGNVRLTGTVDTLEYKSKIESIVQRIDGVKQVDNQIKVSE